MLIDYIAQAKRIHRPMALESLAVLITYQFHKKTDGLVRA